MLDSDLAGFALAFGIGDSNFSRHPPVAKKFQTLSTHIRVIFPRAPPRWGILRRNSAPVRNRTVDAVRGRRGTRGISLCRLKRESARAVRIRHRKSRPDR